MAVRQTKFTSVCTANAVGIAISISILFLVDIRSAHGHEPCLIDRVEPSGDGTFAGNFGMTVAIDGNTALVGSQTLIPSAVGAAYVFTFDGASWDQEQVLQPSDPESGMQFGRKVIVQDDVAIVASSMREAYVFRNLQGTWVEEQKLEPWDPPLGGAFGRSMSISGDRILVGASGDNESDDFAGAAYVFRYDGQKWVPEQKLFPSDPQSNHSFGRGVAIQDDMIAVGAPGDGDGQWPGEPDFASGAIYIFGFDDETGQWIEQQKILPPIPDELTINQLTLGRDIAVSGDTMIGGADPLSIHGKTPCGSTGCGIAFMFSRDPDSGVWGDPQVLQPEQPGIRRFGRAVDIDGDRAIIGAFTSGVAGFGPGSPYEGAALLYERQRNGQWQPRAMFLPEPFWPQSFGRDVAVSGPLTLVGANFENGQEGAAYFHHVDPTPGDLTCNGAVDVGDLLLLLGQWGICPEPEFLHTEWMSCPGDLNSDGVVNVSDLLLMLANWG